MLSGVCSPDNITLDGLSNTTAIKTQGGEGVETSPLLERKLPQKEELTQDANDPSVATWLIASALAPLSPTEKDGREKKEHITL